MGTNTRPLHHGLVVLLALFLVFGFAVTPSVTAAESTSEHHTACCTWTDENGTEQQYQVKLENENDSPQCTYADADISTSICKDTDIIQFLKVHPELKVYVDGKEEIDSKTILEKHQDKIPKHTQVKLDEAEKVKEIVNEIVGIIIDSLVAILAIIAFVLALYKHWLSAVFNAAILILKALKDPIIKFIDWIIDLIFEDDEEEEEEEDSSDWRDAAVKGGKGGITTSEERLAMMEEVKATQAAKMAEAAAEAAAKAAYAAVAAADAAEAKAAAEAAAKAAYAAADAAAAAEAAAAKAANAAAKAEFANSFVANAVAAYASAAADSAAAASAASASASASAEVAAAAAEAAGATVSSPSEGFLGGVVVGGGLLPSL